MRASLADGVARLVLDAPERHNAITAADAAALLDHIERLDADDAVRAVVLTGTGPTFCAGASLEEMESGAMSGERFETLADRLAGLRAPTVCAVNGNLFGGGVELALCCDFRIGVTGSRLAVPAARLGVCYPVGGIERFVRRLGPSAATRILIGNEEIDADEMLRVGVLTSLVAPDALEAETDALAARLADHAPLAVRAMKRIITGVSSGTLDRDDARERVRSVAESADLREGLRARREGRAPRFEGR